MKKRGILYIITVILLVSIWSYFVYSFGAEHFVQVIGVTNGYLLAFFVTLFGGSSLITSISYITVVATLALGGLEPIKLCLISGIGLFIGDWIYYFIARGSQKVLAGNKTINSLAKSVNKLPPLVSSIIIYLYFSSPFPNDFIIILLGLGGYSYRRLVLPLLLGDMTFISFVVYLAKLSS